MKCFKETSKEDSPSDDLGEEFDTFYNQVTKKERPGLELCVGSARKKRKRFGVDKNSQARGPPERSEISRKFAALAKMRKEEEERDGSPPPFCKMGSQEFEVFERELEKVITEGIKEGSPQEISEETKVDADKYSELETKLEEKMESLKQVTQGFFSFFRSNSNY